MSTETQTTFPFRWYISVAFVLFIFLLNEKIQHGPEHEKDPGEPEPFTSPEVFHQPRA